MRENLYSLLGFDEEMKTLGNNIREIYDQNRLIDSIFEKLSLDKTDSRFNEVLKLLKNIEKRSNSVKNLIVEYKNIFNDFHPDDFYKVKHKADDLMVLLNLDIVNDMHTLYESIKIFNNKRYSDDQCEHYQILCISLDHAKAYYD